LSRILKRVRRLGPEVPRTPRQLVAHAAADGLATVYPSAEVIIGYEQVEIRLRSGEAFVLQVYRLDWPEQATDGTPAPARPSARRTPRKARDGRAG
jgi:hypothetical protein